MDDYTDVWDLCISQTLFLPASGSDEPMLCKESIGSLEREHKVQAGGSGGSGVSLLEELTARQYDSPESLKRALQRRMAERLALCTADDMSAVMELLDRETAERSFAIMNCEQWADNQIADFFGSRNNARIQFRFSETAYNGALGSHKHYMEGPGRYYFRRGHKAETKMFVIDLVRFFSEAYMVSECIRYYRDVLKDLTPAERMENIVFHKQLCREAGYSGLHIPDGLIDEDYYGPLVGDNLSGLSDGNIDRERTAFCLGLLDRDDITICYCMQGWCRTEPEKMFYDIYQAKRAEAATRKYLRELEGDYAKSFQPLKGVPQKYIDAAKESGFAEVFGVVEYDPDTDITKLSALADEFKAVMGLFGSPKLSGYAVRFRKLGNHKASGLYYPSVQCLCVDIRTPGSFVHEFFHLMDFKNGHLSEKYSFLKIREKYEKCLKKEMEEKEDVKAVLSGKGKYSLQYYTEPTEVFARCGEMYIKRVLNVSNTLNSVYGGFAYPEEDDQLMELVENYFEGFFKAQGGQNYDE